jgi:antitoxin component YwqK of YwqJK toxin-antitoxin module
MSNKIKSETIYRIDHLPGDEIDLDQEFDGMQSYHEYDEAGRLILEIAYTRDGEIADKVAYRYDETGRMLETSIYGEDDDILERKEIIWSDDKRVMQEIIHYLDGSEDIHEFFYNEQGNVTGMQVKDDEDEIEFSEKYFYDGDKVIKVERLDGEDEIIFRQEDEVENGNLKVRTIWSAEDEEPYTIIQHFNAAGHREEELRYNSRKELIERNIYEENEHGRVVRMIEENKQRKNTTEFSYDDKGNIVYQKETDLNGELNHEIFRFYGPDGEPVKTTVEAIARPAFQKRAYTLIYRREMYA